MPLITVKAATPAIPPGTYPATLIGIAPKSLVTQYTKDPTKPDNFLEWSWSVEGLEITSLTTTATGPKSRIFEYLVALLGADEVKVDAGFDENDLVGKQVMVSIVTNDDGFAKIDRVVSAPRASRPKPAAPITGPAGKPVQNGRPVADPGVGDDPVAVAALGEAEDDLPF